MILWLTKYCFVIEQHRVRLAAPFKLTASGEQATLKEGVGIMLERVL